jgi:hypothetical protein
MSVGSKPSGHASRKAGKIAEHWLQMAQEADEAKNQASSRIRPACASSERFVRFGS